MRSANQAVFGRGLLGVAVALLAQTAVSAGPDSGTNASKCYEDTIAACAGKKGQAYTNCIQEGANICAAIYAGSGDDPSRKPLGLKANAGPASPQVVVQPSKPGRVPVPGATKN